MCPVGLPCAWLTRPTQTERYDSSASNTRLTGQEIPSLLWKLQIQHRVHNCPPLIPILNLWMQSTSFAIFILRSLLILSFIPQGRFLCGLATKMLPAFVGDSMLATCPMRLIFSDFVVVITSGDKWPISYVLRRSSTGLRHVIQPWVASPVQARYSSWHPVYLGYSLAAWPCSELRQFLTDNNPSVSLKFRLHRFNITSWKSFSSSNRRNREPKHAFCMQSIFP